MESGKESGVSGGKGFYYNQAHYTANPTFVGMDDPFPERSWLMETRV